MVFLKQHTCIQKTLKEKNLQILNLERNKNEKITFRNGFEMPK